MWNERYAEPGFAYGTEPNDFLREHQHVLAPGSRVLCLAEGEGRNAVFLAAQGHHVHAVDASAVGLAKAAALAAERGVPLTTEVADLANWNPGAAHWDAIISIWAHLPPHARRALHRAVVRSLAPGGILLLEAYTPDQIPLGTGGPRAPETTMTADTLRDELVGLTFDHLVTTERDVQEGRYHHGRSAVVPLIAHQP